MSDTYFTINTLGKSITNEKRSKFYGFAVHIDNAEDLNTILEPYKKEYYDARHICWSYRIGKEGDVYRINDDGEPSGTAGKPIYGQILSANLSDIIVIVVRYFGGIKLGTSGLIDAYKNAARLAIEDASIVEVVQYSVLSVSFMYEIMGNVMRVIKDFDANIISQDFTYKCELKVSIRDNNLSVLYSSLSSIYGCIVKKM